MPNQSPPVLDVRHLRLLAAVGKTGALTRAAAVVHLSQSAVSRQLAELEQGLGVRLFERRRRGLVATAAGARLVERSAELLEQLRGAERSVRQEVAPPPRVRISTECFTSYHWLPALLAEVRVKRPGASLEIVLEATRAPVEYLRRGLLDIAVTTSSPKDRKLSVTPLFEDELVAIAHPRHPLGKRPHLDASDFGEETLYVYEGQSRDLRRFEQRYFGTQSPGRVERVPLTEAIVGFVEAGFGLGIVARWAVAPELRARRLVAVQLAPGGMRRRWFAVTRVESLGEEIIEMAVRGLGQALGSGS
jgi:LysR family transcriptional regulator, regulator for metE and metH